MTFVASTAYQGEDYRTAYEGMQEGVMGAGDMAVTLVSGRNVSVATGVAYSTGDNAAGQGLYRMFNLGAKQSDNFTNGGIGAGAGNPRLDQIVARAYEQEYDSSGQRKWQLEVVAGTPTSGATLDTRSGAAALPNNACRLADVLVSTSGTLSIRDRRPWARGLFRLLTPTAFSASVAANAFNNVGSAFRLECSGAPLRFVLDAIIGSSGSGNVLAARLLIDGAAFGGMTDTHWGYVPSYTLPSGYHLARTAIPTAGSHVFQLQVAQNAASTASMSDISLTIEEIVRQNAENT